MSGPAQRVYTDEEIDRRLAAELPAWRREDGCLLRTYRTYGWKGALMVANAIAHLAEAAWHHPDLALSYSRVEVRLSDHAAKGVSDKDFELAAKIEAVIHWRPARQAGALEGTPEDRRFAYIRYDD